MVSWIGWHILIYLHWIIDVHYWIIVAYYSLEIIGLAWYLGDWYWHMTFTFLIMTVALLFIFNLVYSILAFSTLVMDNIIDFYTFRFIIYCGTDHIELHVQLKVSFPIQVALDFRWYHLYGWSWNNWFHFDRLALLYCTTCILFQLLIEVDHGIIHKIHLIMSPWLSHNSLVSRVMIHYLIHGILGWNSINALFDTWVWYFIWNHWYMRLLYTLQLVLSLHIFMALSHYLGVTR